MEKPTCKTCQYWEPFDWETDQPGGPFRGECHRNPPGADPTDKPIIMGIDAHWPATIVDPKGLGRSDWCGEHPLFPAYLASLQPRPTQDEDPALNQAKADYHRQRIAELEAEGR